MVRLFFLSKWAVLGGPDFQTSLAKWDYHWALYVTVYTHIGHFDILETFHNLVSSAPSCAGALADEKASLCTDGMCKPDTYYKPAGE